MQLPAAHQHGANLGELAEIPGKAVGLGVDGEELGAGHGLVEQIHERPMQLPASDGLQDAASNVRGGARGGEAVLLAA